MPKFSANLTLLFTEVDFLDRFERAARAGFKAVEYMFPYPYSPDQLKDTLRQHGLQQVLFNLPAGDWDKGERGIALMSDRVDEFKDGVEKAITYAKALGCPRVNCLVGFPPAGAGPEKARATLVSNLRYAARRLQKEGVQLLVEALNNRDFPNFYLTRTSDALSLLADVASTNLFMQYDIYHMQVMEGNLTDTIRQNLKTIGHIQLADNPGRHEPGTGEINFTNLFRFIDEAGYAGYIGAEYRPAAKTEDGLDWVKPYL
jgi:hydroxypyruvate isomerase